MLVGIVLPVLVHAFSVQPGARVVRALFEADDLTAGPFAEEAGAVDVTEVTLPGAPAARLRLSVPPHSDAALRPVIFWMHGGGWISGSAAQIDPYTRVLAAQGFTVASLDYTVAPDARYPVPVEQANAALAYLRTEAPRFGGDPTQIFLGGDSAGAQIASQVAALQTSSTLREQMHLTAALEPEHLRGVVLFCGFYDMSTVMRTGFPALRTFGWAYLGRRAWVTHPRIEELSTVRTATSDYPDVYLTVGDGDPFEDQAYELDAVLRARGVDVTSRYWTGTGENLPHEYQFDLDTAPGRTVLEDVVAFVEARAT